MAAALGQVHTVLKLVSSGVIGTISPKEVRDLKNCTIRAYIKIGDEDLDSI